jgi:hypothetical protein
MGWERGRQEKQDRLRRGGRGVHTHAFVCFSQATRTPTSGTGSERETQMQSEIGIEATHTRKSTHEHKHP